MFRIYFDVDGVLRNTNKILFHSENVKWEDWTKETFEKVNEYTKEIYYLYPKINIPFKNFINSFFKRAKKDDHISIIGLSSQKTDKMKKSTGRFCNDFYKIPCICVKGFEEKLEILKKEKNSILIDDYPHFRKCDSFDEIRDRIYLYSAPWNEKIDHNSRYVIKNKNGVLLMRDNDVAPWYDIDFFEYLFSLKMLIKNSK